MDAISEPKSQEIITALQKKQGEYTRRMLVVYLMGCGLLLIIIPAIVRGGAFIITAVILAIILICARGNYVDALYKHWVIKKRLDPERIDGYIYLYEDETPFSFFTLTMSTDKREKIFNRAMRVINDYCTTGGENTFKERNGKRVPSPLPM